MSDIDREKLPKVIDEFERQIGFQLPSSYKIYMLNRNGGIPEKDNFEIPGNNARWPAQLNEFYSFESDDSFSDIWDTYLRYKAELPRGVIKIGTLGIECAEICLDFRKKETGWIAGAIKSVFSSPKYLDGGADDVPVKFLDWVRMFNTGKWRESDLKPIAKNFETFMSMLRDLTDSEKDEIKKLASESGVVPEPDNEPVPIPKPLPGETRPPKLSVFR